MYCNNQKMCYLYNIKSQLKQIKMKATKKQIAEVTKIANELGFSVEMSIKTLENTSASIYKAIGAVGVVESSMRANSKYFVDTLSLAKEANKKDVSIASLMTEEEKAINLKF